MTAAAALAFVSCLAALADGGVEQDGGIVPSSVWLDGPSASRPPQPGEPVRYRDDRFLTAAAADGGAPAQRPVHPSLQPFVDALSGADGGEAWVLVPASGNDDGGWLPGLPPLRLALPLGPEQPEDFPSHAPMRAPASVPTTPLESGRSAFVLQGRQMPRLGVDSTVDAVDALPAVHLRRNYPAGGNAMMRGMGGSRVALFVDGLRLNHAGLSDGLHPALATVDGDAIDTIEVVLGPSGALHGSGAMGGVIAIRERMPSPVAGLSVHTDGRAFFRSADQGRGIRFYSEGGAGPFAASIAGDVVDGQDLKAGRSAGLQFYTIQRNMNLQARSRLDVAGQQLVAAFDAWRQNTVPITSLCRHAPERSSADCTDIGEQARDLAYLGVVLHPGALFDDIEAKAAWHRNRLVLLRTNWNQVVRDRSSDVIDTFGGYAVARSKMLVVGPLWVRAVLGADAYHDVVDSTFHRLSLSSGAAQPAGPGLDDRKRTRLTDGGRMTSAAVHTLVEVRVLERLGLRVGGRGNLQGVRAFDEERDPAAVDRVFIVPSGFAQLLFFLDNLAVTSAGVYHGYHIPNLYDLTGRTFTELGYERPDDPALAKVEHAFTFEATQRLQLWRLEASATVYATRWLDSPRRRLVDGELFDDAPVYVRTQDTDATLVGAEAFGDLRILRHIHVTGSFSIDHGERTLGADPVPGVFPPSGSLGLAYLPPLGFYGVLRCDFALRARRLSVEDRASTLYDPEGTPQAVVFHAGGGYQLGDRAAIDLFVENVTDESYRFHGGGYAMPGTSARIQLRLGF